MKQHTGRSVINTLGCGYELDATFTQYAHNVAVIITVTCETIDLVYDYVIHAIDIRGLSFKRYLEIAKQTGSKVAVITDNDKDYQKNCIEKYVDYATDQNIQIFFHDNNNRRTFEIVLYDGNQTLCDSLFGDDAQGYMLRNKTEAAFSLLSQNQAINVPDYIKRAIDWIRE